MPLTGVRWCAFYLSDTCDAAGQPRRSAQRSDDLSNLVLDYRNVPFERAAHGRLAQRHARDMERARPKEEAGRAAMATGDSGRSVSLAAAESYFSSRSVEVSRPRRPRTFPLTACLAFLRARALLHCSAP